MKKVIGISMICVIFVVSIFFINTSFSKTIDNNDDCNPISFFTEDVNNQRTGYIPSNEFSDLCIANGVIKSGEVRIEEKGVHFKVGVSNIVEYCNKLYFCGESTKIEIEDEHAGDKLFCVDSISMLIEWSLNIGEIDDTKLTYFDHKLFFGINNGHFYIVDTEKHNILTDYQFDNFLQYSNVIYLSPIVHKNNVYVSYIASNTSGISLHGFLCFSCCTGKLIANNIVICETLTIISNDVSLYMISTNKNDLYKNSNISIYKLNEDKLNENVTFNTLFNLINAGYVLDCIIDANSLYVLTMCIDEFNNLTLYLTSCDLISNNTIYSKPIYVNKYLTKKANLVSNKHYIAIALEKLVLIFDKENFEIYNVNIDYLTNTQMVITDDSLYYSTFTPYSLTTQHMIRLDLNSKKIFTVIVKKTNKSLLMIGDFIIIHNSLYSFYYENNNSYLTQYTPTCVDIDVIKLGYLIKPCSINLTLPKNKTYKAAEVKSKVGWLKIIKSTIKGNNLEILFNIDTIKMPTGRDIITTTLLLELQGYGTSNSTDGLIPMSFTPDISYNIITMKIGNRSYRINNNLFMQDCAPITKNNYTLVPVRSISEAFNVTVKWIAIERSVEIKGIINNKEKTIKLTINQKSIIINNKDKLPIDVAPIMLESDGDKTFSIFMIPLRVLSVHLGSKLCWYEDKPKDILIAYPGDLHKCENSYNENIKNDTFIEN